MVAAEVRFDSLFGIGSNSIGIVGVLLVVHATQYHLDATIAVDLLTYKHVVDHHGDEGLLLLIGVRHVFQLLYLIFHTWVGKCLQQVRMA